ncbi:hypothetical protein BDN71DRAFT_1418491 [Pleurotus eryngii]|uniref:Uncharacterized protein n=1 Tax=Pleurotus eryngii TaxID=5323 RepID=A0A9P5ZV92_PLEER|nr:hypothetical protein BDN71DRAFT_1418491 [Pleurotus eryngii]
MTSSTRGRTRSRSPAPRNRSRSPRPERRRRDHRPSRSRSTSPTRLAQRSRRSRSRSRSPRTDRRREKARERSQDGDRERNIRKRGRSRSRSVSSSSSSSSDHKRRKRKKDKHRKRHGSKERKEKKKSKKLKVRCLKSGGEKPHWGKYGIITESDMFNKASEFHTWLVEERKINPETVSKDQNKKEFSRFVEDFNTATLPHEKYYNMEAYDRRMAALRAGEYVPPQNDSYDPNADMRALQGVHKRKVVEQDTYLSKEQLQELRKVQQERIQASKMKSMGMDVPQTMGVRMDGSMFDE